MASNEGEDFSGGGTYTQSVKVGGVWLNEWRKNAPSLLRAGLSLLTNTDKSAIPNEAELNKTIPVERPYWLREDKKEVGAPGVRATWLGHATVLAEVDGSLVLCDPMFSKLRCEKLLGVPRYRPPACEISELPPKLEAVVISHTHYDHMDEASILQLHKSLPSLLWLVPDGVKSWFQSIQIPSDKVKEFKWWQEETLPRSGARVIFTPSNHYSNRSVWDVNTCLWGSWTVIGRKKSGGKSGQFWFGGDTAYCDVFKEIGNRFGAFDLAAIPIGAYEPNYTLRFSHVNPEEAIKIHDDIGSKKSMAIHWGTFKLSNEHYLEPKEKIEAQKNERSDLHFEVVNIGATVEGSSTN